MSAEAKANTAELDEQLQSFDAPLPFSRALPYGIQHVLAMFVANLAPIALICAAAGFDEAMTSMLIQNAMIMAAIGTFVQLFPLWRVGARMPIVMGVSFTFVTVLCTVAAQYGYGAVMGAVIVGGLCEGVLGLLAKYWRRFITPVVSGVVVTAIGFSLLSVGAQSFGGGSGAADFGSPENLILGFVSLVSCLLFQGLAKGSAKQLSVLFGLAVGYVLALIMGKVDFSVFEGLAVVSLPTFMPFTPTFEPGAIVAVVLLYLVSAAECLGDTAALAAIGFKRIPTEREFAGAVSCDGFVSAVGGLFGCSPLTTFAQNIGLIAMTHVVNRRAILCGGIVLLLAGFVPAISAVFSSLPDAVLGGCTIMMFGSIIVSGFQMISNAGFSQRNITIVAVSLAVGIGFSQVSDIFVYFPELLQNIFVGNSIALTFLTAVVLNLTLSKEPSTEGTLIVPRHSRRKKKAAAQAAQANDGAAPAIASTETAAAESPAPKQPVSESAPVSSGASAAGDGDQAAVASPEKQSS